MKILKIIWEVVKNLIGLAIFGGMLSVTNSGFQTVVVAGLGLIYVTIAYYGTEMVRLQLTTYISTTEQFIRTAKLNGHGESIEWDEKDLKTLTDKFKSNNVFYYINTIFNAIFWIVAIVAIVSSL